MGKMSSLEEKLKEMAAVDIKSVDPATLKDIADVIIDPELPREERVRSFIHQIGNPYCYLDHGKVIKIAYTDNGETLDSCMEHFLECELLNCGV